MSNDADWQTIGQLGQWPENQLIPVQVNGIALVMVVRGGRPFVYQDRCPHVDYPLSVGHVEGDEIVCTWHGACFAVETGDVRCPPSPGPLFRIATRLKRSFVQVNLSTLNSNLK